MPDDEGSQGEGAGGTARGSVERHELSKRQTAVARRVAEGKATIPHAYARRRVSLPGSGGTAAVVAAAATALAEHPALNAAYRDGAVERYSRVNVGFLIETPQGALVPTLFDADRMTMDQIDAQLGGWRAAGGTEELAAPQLSGGTFTVSAVEDGADEIGGIVTPGQAGHLAIGRPRSEAVVTGGKLGTARVRDLTLSCDQRAVRPPEAAAFLGTVARLLEEH